MTLSESQHAAYSRHWNPGQLPADWTLEKLMAKHASHPFNPDIANAFFRAGLIESWGRGIERITEIELQDNPAANHFKAVVRRLPADDTLAENAKAESKAESLEVRVLRALQSGPTTAVAAIDKSSLALVLILSVLILHEPFTWKTAVGVGLILGGTLVVTLK